MKLKTTLKTLIIVLGCIGTLYAQCTFTGLNSNYCVNSPSSTLSSTTTGGTFSGPGVVGSAFSPSVAGPGTHTITYAICSNTYAVAAGTYSAYGSAGNVVSL
jgi:hypothetical protein